MTITHYLADHNREVRRLRSTHPVRHILRCLKPTRWQAFGLGMAVGIWATLALAQGFNNRKALAMHQALEAGRHRTPEQILRTWPQP